MKHIDKKIFPKNKENTTLLSKMIITMTVLSILQIVIIVVVMSLSGEFRYIKKFSYNSVSEKTENRRNYVENSMNSKTALVYEAAAVVNGITESILRDEGLTASAVRENKELNKKILSASADEIISLIRRDMVNDAFIILDSGELYNEGGRSNKTGLYFRDMDVNENSVEDNADIYMEMGSSEIARSLGLPLDYEWSLYMDMTDTESGNFSFFYEAMEGYAKNPDAPLYNLGRWDKFSGVSQSTQQSMKYTLPLVSEDGTVYGVIGIGLLKKTVLQSIPSNDFFNEGACYILAADLDRNGIYEPLLTSGPAYGRLVNENTVLSRKHESEYGLYDFSAGGTECIGSIQDLTLYVSGSPFRDQKWALISVADKGRTLNIYTMLLKVFFISVIITLIFGIVFAVFASRRISSPVREMVKNLEASRENNSVVRFTFSGIREIDNLADAIVGLQIDAMEYSSRVSRIITMAGSAIGVFKYDIRSRSVFVGESLIKLLGFTSLPYRDTTITEEEFRAQLGAVDKDGLLFDHEIFADGDEAPESGSIEIMYEDPVRGEDRWFRFSLTRSSADIIGLVQDITDTVTEKKQIAKVKDDEYSDKLMKANDALKGAYAIAKQANSAKTDFLSRMSHDIRTPMNSIIGLTAIAECHLDDGVKVGDCLKKIEVSGRYLLSLINEVLDMSKIESGKFVLNEEKINIPDLIDNTIEIVRPAVRDKKHELKVDIVDVRHENVIGDSTRIQQAFVNILSNAVKYTPEGGHIRFVMTEKPVRQNKIGCYEFKFCDDGIGMSEEFLKKLYEPFERATDVRMAKESGTGLGMSITKNIVEMMDGDIKVESEIGKGTVFTVTIFLKLQENDDAYAARFAGMRALVADNDGAAAQKACSFLSELGIACEYVLSGQEAAELARAKLEQGEPFDFVLLDLYMKQSDGIDTARKIRTSLNDKAPVIILTGYDWFDIEKEARAAGVDGFIGKPLFKSKLISVIESVFGGKHGGGKSLDVISSNDFSGSRVLLVDDNELNREIACEILEMTGLEVESAEDGREAVEKFSESEEGRYQMIFMDIQMPVMNGYDAAVAIRAMSRSDARTVPIVAMTADAFAEDVMMAKNAGMNDHVAKPLDFDRLTEVLKQWLQQ